MADADSQRELDPVLDLIAVPRPALRVDVIIQVNWLALATTFLQFPLQHEDVLDLELIVARSDAELQFPVDMAKAIFSNFIWHFHRRRLRRREFQFILIHPFNSSRVPLNYDSSWQEILTAQAIPKNVGLLTLEVQLSPIHVFDPTPWPAEQP